MKRIWTKKELPYVSGRKKIMVEVSRDGLTFWKKRSAYKMFVPWGKVIPFQSFYTGENDESFGIEPAAPSFGKGDGE